MKLLSKYDICMLSKFSKYSFIELNSVSDSPVI